MKRRIARAWVSPVVAAILLAARLSAAQPAGGSQPPLPPSEALELFSEATQAMGRKEFTAACPKLERVVELVPDGIGAKLALGDCYVGIGRLASAQRAYVGAEAAAAAANQAQRQKEARSKADALVSKLARMTLEIAPELRALPELSVSRDGVPIGSAELGIAVAIDAGSHVVVVSAKDRLPHEERLEIADGQKIVVRVSELKPRPAESPGASTAPPTTPPVESPKPPPPEHPFWGGQRVAGLSIGIAGVLALGAGATLGGLTKVAVDDSNELGCDPETAVCTNQDAYDRRSQALTFAHASTGTLIGGGVLLVTGIIVFATSPTGAVEVAAGPAGVFLRGKL